MVSLVQINWLVRFCSLSSGQLNPDELMSLASHAKAHVTQLPHTEYVMNEQIFSRHVQFLFNGRVMACHIGSREARQASANQSNDNMRKASLSYTISCAIRHMYAHCMQLHCLYGHASVYVWQDTSSSERYLVLGLIMLKENKNDIELNMFNGWRTKVRKTTYAQYGQRCQTSRSKAATSNAPSPPTFNVDKTCHEMGLRNFVPSHSLLSQLLRHNNFELWGNGDFTKSNRDSECPNIHFANFCPSTVLSHRCCIDGRYTLHMWWLQWCMWMRRNAQHVV